MNMRKINNWSRKMAKDVSNHFGKRKPQGRYYFIFTRLNLEKLSNTCIGRPCFTCFRSSSLLNSLNSPIKYVL